MLPITIETAKRQNPSANRTNLRVLAGWLSDANEYPGVFLDHLPVYASNTKPSVIDIYRFFYCVTDSVYEVDSVPRAMVGTLGKNVNPNFVVLNQ